MKIKFVKILIGLLLFIAPAIGLAYNVNAENDCVWVSKYHIELSPKSLINLKYLNSTDMKLYLLECLERSKCLNDQILQEMREKLICIRFYCFSQNLRDPRGRFLLRIWIPVSPLAEAIFEFGGTQLTVPLDYVERARSFSI